MIKSMTGFASLTNEDPAASIGVTLKSVNHRFLDLQLRTPGSLAALESRMRALVQSRVARGRVELAITVQPRRESSVEVELNEAFLNALKPALGSMEARLRSLVQQRVARGRVEVSIAVQQRRTPSI